MSDCGLLSCALIERVNKGQKPPKRGMAGRETPIPKGSVSHRRSGIHRVFSHIAHKRRNVRFKGARRVHTPPRPRTAHTAAHTPKHGVFQMGVLSLPSERFARFGKPAWPGVRTAYFAAFRPWSGVLPKSAESLRDSDALMRVAVPRRRGPAGLRDPVAVPLTALIGFTILLSRIVAHRKLSACSLVTAVRFWNRCLRRSMRETYPLEQRSGCRF